MTTELNEGNTVYVVTEEFEIEEFKVYHYDKIEDELFVIHPIFWEERNDPSRGYPFNPRPNQYRQTRPEALHLLLQKLSERRKDLMREASEITDKIADVINEMYPE
jgi:hypothetical protein